jgi:protein arginine N-methyltransferase 2
MSDLHDLCRFQTRPITEDYVERVKYYLKSGIPATYTVEEAYNYTNGIEEEPKSTTTPLHLICSNIPADISKEELAVVDTMVETLLEYGAGWCLIDADNNTPGCILIKRKLNHLSTYQHLVQAGVRAELLLRKVSEFDVEVIEDTDDLNHDQFTQIESDNHDQDQPTPEEVPAPEEKSIETKPVDSAENTTKDDGYDLPDAPSHNQDSYLQTKLEYTDDSLVTKNRKDGVMMAWESDLMQLGCDSLFKGAIVDEKTQEKDEEIVVLNIGFGMGIIDSMIQQKNPTKHYICEAHPDVLAKLKKDGWYEKPNVVILEGRWQDNLDNLLSAGTFFNGIYYDTFSEHYEDMLELFDYIVGLLKPHGVFSFFNGLGADRQVIYEVYKQLVEIDLSNYGLKCTFNEVVVPESTLQKDDKSVWDDVKRSYWSCPVYYHPEAKFATFDEED